MESSCPHSDPETSPSSGRRTSPLSSTCTRSISGRRSPPPPSTACRFVWPEHPGNRRESAPKMASVKGYFVKFLCFVGGPAVLLGAIGESTGVCAHVSISLLLKGYFVKFLLWRIGSSLILQCIGAMTSCNYIPQIMLTHIFYFLKKL